MASFLDVCRFTPTAGSTTDWTYSSPVTGYQSPTAAGVVNGSTYRYRAESLDLSQWEVGTGIYNTGTGVLTRTTVLYNSAGTGTGSGQTGAGTKINFSIAPQVAIVALAEDLVGGWSNLYASAKSATYPVVTSDSGGTLNPGSNSFFEMTFGAASSYPSNFAVMIRNVDLYSGIGTGRGKRINLNGTKFILYPGQNVLIFNGDGSTWDYHPKNQRWVQGGAFICCDTGGGAFGSVDGLATGAGAFLSLQDAASTIWYGMDMAGNSATIYPTAGQTFAQTLNLGGQPIGSNVVFLKGNGGQATIQGTNGSDTVSVGDNAELIIQDMYVRSSNNTFGKAALKMHGNGLIDAFSGVTIEGGGVNDVGVFIDNGPGIFAQFSTLTFTNTFNSLIWADRGGNLSIGALITNSGGMAVSKIMTLKGVGYTTIGTQITTTGWGGGLGASPVNTGHVLNLNGTTMPGGTSVTAPGVVIP